MPKTDEKKEIMEGSTKERALELLKERYHTSTTYQNPHFTRFVKYYELYRGVQTNKHYQGRANLFVPEPYANLESVHARVVRSYQGVRAIPQESEDVEKVESVEMLLDWQSRVYNFKQAFNDAWKDACIYGTGVLKAGWVFTNDGKRDHPTLEAIDVLDYFFDPEAVSRQDARWEIHRTFKTLTEIKKNPKYTDVDKIDANRTAPIADAAQSFKERRDAVVGGAKINQAKGKHEVIEYWGLFNEDPDDPSGEKEYLITAVDGQVIVRLEENPYLEVFENDVVDENMARPFIVFKDTDIPHEFYGLGEIEPIEKLIEELNDTRNQRMDNVTMIIDRMWEVLDSADIDENELVARAGGIIHSSIPGGVTPLPTGDVTQSAYNEEQIIKQDIQKAIGLPDVATGSLQGAQGETATTILSLQESANIRFDTKLSRFADGVRHAYSLILAYDQQWMDREVIVRIEGEHGYQFPKVDKEAIRGKFDIDIQMDTQMNKIVRRQEALQLYTTLASNPMVNQQANTKILLETLDRKEIKELMDVPPPQPIPPEEPKKTISVNLKGDLNSLESDDIAVIMGARQESADPLLRKDTRELMQGIQPEKIENELRKLEIQEKYLEEKRLSKREESDGVLRSKELELKDRELTLKEKETGIKREEIAKKDRGLANRVSGFFRR